MVIYIIICNKTANGVFVKVIHYIFFYRNPDILDFIFINGWPLGIIKICAPGTEYCFSKMSMYKVYSIYFNKWLVIKVLAFIVLRGKLPLQRLYLDNLKCIEK